MIRRMLLIVGCLVLMLCAQKVHAQRPASGFKPGDAGADKPWIPESDEAKAEKAKDKEKAQDPDHPLTKRELRRKMKQEEKERKQAYNEHHDRIQTKAIRKRMKENEKRSKKINEHTGPTFWERLFHKKRH